MVVEPGVPKMEVRKEVLFRRRVHRSRVSDLGEPSGQTPPNTSVGSHGVAQPLSR